MSEAIKPLLLALAQPLSLLLQWLGITADEEQTRQVLLAVGTVLGILATWFAPSFRALFRFKEDAK